MTYCMWCRQDSQSVKKERVIVEGDGKQESNVCSSVSNPAVQGRQKNDERTCECVDGGSSFEWAVLNSVCMSPGDGVQTSHVHATQRRHTFRLQVASCGGVRFRVVCVCECMHMHYFRAAWRRYTYWVETDEALLMIKKKSRLVMFEQRLPAVSVDVWYYGISRIVHNSIIE